MTETYGILYGTAGDIQYHLSRRRVENYRPDDEDEPVTYTEVRDIARVWWRPLFRWWKPWTWRRHWRKLYTAQGSTP